MKGNVTLTTAELYPHMKPGDKFTISGLRSAPGWSAKLPCIWRLLKRLPKVCGWLSRKEPDQVFEVIS